MKIWLLQPVVLTLFMAFGCGDPAVARDDTRTELSDSVPVVNETEGEQAEIASFPADVPTSTARCKDAKGEQRTVCNSVLPPGSIEDQVILDTFEITTAKIDLNGDHVDEVVVWESSWAGTSGGGLWVFSARGRRYTKLFETDMAWTPILLLPSFHNGWRDIAYHVTGGGVEPVFVTIESNGRGYADAVHTDKQPLEGDVLIGQGWHQTVFGPAADR